MSSGGAATRVAAPPLSVTTDREVCRVDILIDGFVSIKTGQALETFRAVEGRMSLTRTSGGARSTASVTDLRSLAPADPFAPEASGFARVRLMPLAASPGLRASGSAAVLASPLASYTMSPVISSASVRKLKPLSDERETIRKVLAVCAGAGSARADARADARATSRGVVLWRGDR